MLTTNLSLPLLAAGQAQKHVTHNEALVMVDTLLQLAVINRTLTAPPASPVEGDRYLIPGGATGSWSTQTGKVATFVDSNWQYYQPKTGWLLWITAENAGFVYDGTAFVPLLKFDLVEKLGINATADATNRLTVKAHATLLDNQGSGHQLKINKANAAATGSTVYQTAYSGRAEIGLSGDDNLKFKVSADGTTWRTALEIDRTSGNIGIGQVPSTTEPLRLRLNQNTNSQFIVENADTGTLAASGMSLLAANGNYFRMQLYSSGNMFAFTTAPFFIGTYANAPLYLRTNTQDRIVINGDGRVTIGGYAHSAKLYVDGAMRPKSYTVTTLPVAATEGAGAMIYVSNDAAGPTVAFSDGTNWRRVHDRAIVA